MIVHFIGHAGTGKSTLVAQLAAEGGYLRPPAGLARILSPAEWLLPITFPLTWPMGRRLAAHNPDSGRGLKAGAWTATVAMQKARQLVLPRTPVHLIDHAMTNMLRRHADESMAFLLDKLPLPDLVVHVSAPGAVRKARVVRRKKCNHAPRRYLFGERAMKSGKKHARRWSALWGEEEAMRCLRAWSQWQCRPELGESELRSLLARVEGAPLSEADEAALRCDPLPKQCQWLYNGYQDQGVHWINVTNDGRESLENLACRIVQEITQLRDTTPNGR